MELSRAASRRLNDSADELDCATNQCCLRERVAGRNLAHLTKRGNELGLAMAAKWVRADAVTPTASDHSERISRSISEKTVHFTCATNCERADVDAEALAAGSVVPPPTCGSKTRSPGLVKSSMAAHRLGIARQR
jgi:hypothetical protein